MAAERSIVVLCNPLAGVGRSLRLTKEIEAKLVAKKIGYKIFKAEWPKELSDFTNVFIVGGDGTLNFFINKYRDIEIPITVFDGGTGNDFHWLLYGKTNPGLQLESSLCFAPKRIDAGKCNERLFINGVGIGFEGAVAKSLTGKKKLAGKTSFLIAILKKIFLYRSREYKIHYTNASEGRCLTESGMLLMISIMNGRRAGGGFHVAPESLPDDGFLDVVFVSPLSPMQRLRYLPVIEKGKHLDLPFISIIKTTKIIVEGNILFDAHLDGEYYSSKRFEIEIMPGKFLFC